MPTSDNKLIAGMVSFNGLIPSLGNTAEKESGLMTIPSIFDWVVKLNASSYTDGPTGSWAKEWWSVYNYLYYGSGICIVGATGSTGDYYVAGGGLCLTNTPLHNKNLVNLDVVFEGGNTSSSYAAANIATTRTDCLAFLGNNIPLITGLTSAYNKHFRDFGVTASSGSTYVSYFAGSKKVKWGNLVEPKENQDYIIEISTSSDAAGCLSNVINSSNKWGSAAGISRGKISNVENLSQKYLSSDATYLSAGNVNTLQKLSLSGEPSYYIMGNKTGNTGNTNTLFVTIYVKKEIASMLNQYKFGANNQSTRANIYNSASNILRNLVNTNGLAAYTIVCDDTNNTANTVAAGTIIVDLDITPVSEVDSVHINFKINGNTVNIDSV